MAMSIQTEDLKKYLSGVLEMELNLYVQERTISNIEQKYESLAKYRNIRKPVAEKAKFTESTSKGFGIAAPICALLAAVIAVIMEYDGTFFGIVGSVIMAAIYAALGAVIGGIPLGIIIGLFVHKSTANKYKSEYQGNIKNYNDNINKDNSRVKREKLQKAALKKELDVMYNCYYKTKNNLKTIYSYNILEPDYRNIYAVSSIYGYIKKGRTHSLTFNADIGDQGAYNIYEQERRLDIIITNTDEILRRLDEVVNNQYELANGLQEANLRINSLCNNVNNHINRISNSINTIERCQSVIAYNSERAANELAFMNWINYIRY